MIHVLKISCGKESLDKVIMTKNNLPSIWRILGSVHSSIFGFHIFVFRGKRDIAYLTHNSLCGVDGWGV